MATAKASPAETATIVPAAYEDPYADCDANTQRFMTDPDYGWREYTADMALEIGNG
jgi:hypothetical protein